MVNTSKVAAIIVVGLMVFNGLALLSDRADAEQWIKTDMGLPYNTGVTAGLTNVSVGDGDRDNATEVYFSCGDDGAIYQFRFNESNSSWGWKSIGAVANDVYNRAQSVIVGDGDDDGKNEVYVGGGHRWWIGSWTNQVYQFYYNNSAWTRVTVGTATTISYGLALGDGNNDGRKEVFSGEANGHLYMYTKSGASWNSQDMGNPPQFWYNSQWNTPIIRGIALGDGDNDTRNELYAATSNHHVYRYNWTGATWNITDVGIGENDYTANHYTQGMTRVAIGDVDNDTKKEVYSVSYINASVYRFEWDNSSKSWGRTNLVTLGAGMSALDLCIGDGNGDKKAELYAGCSNKQVYEVAYSADQWSSSSIGSGNGAMNGVDIGSARNDSFNRVYAASADGHGYEFIDDYIPPNNPTVTSDSHPVPGTWYDKNVVHVTWTDVGTDISGIDGYSYAWDTSSGTVPVATKTVEETVHEATSSALADSDSHYFHIRARDNALNWNATATHFGPIKIDTTPPDSLSVSIDSGAEYTNNKVVTLSLVSNDPSPGSGVATISFSNDGSLWSNWESYAASRAGWDLTDTTYGGNNSDGTKYVFAKIRDLVGHEIAVAKRASDSIFLDRVEPTDLSITINDGATYSSSSDVTLALNASDPAPASGVWRMSFSNDGVTYSNWTDWNVTGSWSLTAGAGGFDSDGTKTVYFKAEDRAGNVAGPVSASIFLDRVAPDQLSLMINSGAGYTTETTVNLTISARDPDPGSGLFEMTLANDANSLGTWETYTTSKSGWSLINGTGGTDTDGNKTVYLKVNDNASNVGGPVTDSIFLDRARPNGLSITINGGATYTTSVNVKLSLKAADADPSSGLWVMQFSDDGANFTMLEPYGTEKAYTLSSGDGTKTVYFRVWDHAGNVAEPVTATIILDTAPPVISNVKVIGITDTSAIITWTTDEDSDSGVDFGLTSTYGSTRTDTGFVTSHSIALSGLSPTTTYHFQAYSKDRAGNLPSYSGDHSFNTIATPDTTPPEISNVLVSGITDRLAVIGWNTNEEATSLVEYGRDTSYGLTSSDAGYTLGHTVTLRDLTPSTLYHFRVKSSDSSGNGPTVSADYTVTTTATPDITPPVISSVKVGGLTDRLAVISWETDEPADGSVEYGLTTEYGQSMSHPELLAKHELTLNGLNASTTYHFRVKSRDGTGNGPTLSADYNFTTLATADKTPPTITNVMVEGNTESSATVLWNTDEIADGIVEFGTTGAYGLTSAVSGFTRQHSITLTGLKPDTLYHLRVSSTDPSANSAVSGDYTFRTKKAGGGQDNTPPVISNIQVSGVTDTRAVVIWETDELANSEVEYGNSTAYGQRSSDASYVKVHSIIVEGLQPSTSYHLRVKSTDVVGNGPSLSGDLNFTTNLGPDVTPPVISGVKAMEVTNNSVTIYWTTDEPATALVEYGKDPSYGSNVSSGVPTLTHTLRITGLKPGTTYHFRVVSVDITGNRASPSSDNEFTTLKVAPPSGGKPTANEFPWWLVAVAVLVAVGLAAAVIVVGRRPKQSVPQDGPMPAAQGAGDDVEELEMEEPEPIQKARPGAAPPSVPRPQPLPPQPQAVLSARHAESEVGWGAPPPAAPRQATASARLGAAAAPAAATVSAAPPQPIKFIRCSTCKTRIPIYKEGPQQIQCPGCGKQGPYRPKTQ